MTIACYLQCGFLSIVIVPRAPLLPPLFCHEVIPDMVWGYAKIIDLVGSRTVDLLIHSLTCWQVSHFPTIPPAPTSGSFKNYRTTFLADEFFVLFPCFLSRRDVIWNSPWPRIVYMWLLLLLIIVLLYFALHVFTNQLLLVYLYNVIRGGLNQSIIVCFVRVLAPSRDGAKTRAKHTIID